MAFIFGRRRSQSDATSGIDHRNGPGRHGLLRHPPSGAHGVESSDTGIFNGLFRRRGDSVSSPDSPKPVKQPSQECLPRTDAREVPKQEARSDKRCSVRSTSSSSNSPSSSPGSPEPPSAVAHGEPKQLGNIQDFLEYRLDKAGSSRSDDAEAPHNAQGEFVLTKKDVKAILSGAPHFLLERGKHGRWYPQVIFPWDEHRPSIQRMLDRKPLSHASFTLCTLHAHLPVPDDWAVKGGVPIPLRDWSRTGAPKRATFDVGIFEVPNMLANNGREPGTVGLRHFLELAIGDEVRYTGPDEPRQAPNLQNVSKLPVTEAFELMDSYNKPFSQCQSGAIFDRKRFIRDGPTAWKRIGVRDISLRALVKRMNELQQLRLAVLRDGSTMTVLDIETPRELHNILHTQFLFPHPPLARLMAGHLQSLKSQIKTLTTVLATPGAWIDFSLPEWRFRAGQILWEAPPHVDGDCAEPSAGTTREPWVNSGMERKWLLVQLLLSAELLFRLDAFVRVMLHDPHGGEITMQELHHFDKLREGKVNWDLIVVRRFLDNLQIACGLAQSERPPAGNQSQTSTDRSPAKPCRLSLLESISRRVSSTPEPELRSAWQCHISSLHVRQQLEGLYVFAENIGWPNMDNLRSAFDQKLQNGKYLFSPREGHCELQQISDEPVAVLPGKEDMYSRSPSRRCVKLLSSSPQDNDPHAGEPLGWISRSLLSGFVIPGDSICHLLIGTLLENDRDAIEQLGPTANLYGSFVYKGRSWWSEACIVGRVLSGLEGAKTCMGWVGSDVLPCDAITGQPLGQSWFEVKMNKVPCSSGKSRIQQAGKLAVESTPLGMGDITAEAFTLPVDSQASIPPSTVKFEKLSLSVTSPQKRGITICDGAETSFSLQGGSLGSPTTVSLPLKYNVRFVSAHECRPPLGFTSHSQSKSDSEKDPEQRATKTWTEYQRIPGHPLHQSFPYRHVSLESLHERSASGTESPPSKASETLVIDARGNKVKETFARAWCASIGYHALIGRVGRSCVACCVREARAIDVPLVIRVSD